MYMVGQPYYVGIVAFKEDNQQDIDVLCLVNDEKKIEEVLDNASARFSEKYHASLVSKDDRRRKYVSKDKKIEIDVFFVERILAGKRNEIKTN